MLWLIKGLGPGGAERLLVHVAEASHRPGLEFEAAYLLPWKAHLVGDLERAGVPTHCLEAGRLWDLRWLLRLRRIVRRGRFDVVHVHSPIVAALARPVLRSIRPRPRVFYTEHNNWTSYGWLTRLLSRATYGMDDVDLAVSPDAKADLPASLQRRVEVLVHGVPLAQLRRLSADRRAVRLELGLGDDEFIVVTVANYRRDKDYPTLLQAASQVLAGNGAGVTFLAIGQGPLAAEIEALHAQLGLGDRLRLLGYRPDATRVLAAADLFVLSSRHEGLPVALMEALALGVPVVATRAGGVVGAITDGVEGTLVPPGSPAALAAAIDRMVSEPDLRRTAAAAALERSEAFSVERAVARLDELYLSAQPGGPGEG